jgi:C-terminal processing protease CtpA/Prc
MSKIATLVGAILIALASPATAAETNPVERAVKMYERISSLPREKLEHCGALLRSELSAGGATTGSIPEETIAMTDRKMHEDKCLDEYSSLLPEEKWWMQISEQYLFLNIKAFWGAANELADGFRMLPSNWKDSVRTVVIDLRGNRGGSVNDLRDVLDRYFAPGKGKMFMTVEATDYPEFQVTTQRGVLAGFPIIILADSGTASTAEWMIKTLRFEWFPDTTLIVGPTKTYGKAIIQCWRLEEGFFLKATCGEWKIADQRVQGVGIEPDRTRDLGACGKSESCLADALSKMSLR